MSLPAERIAPAPWLLPCLPWGVTPQPTEKEEPKPTGFLRHVLGHRFLNTPPLGGGGRFDPSFIGRALDRRIQGSTPTCHSYSVTSGMGLYFSEPCWPVYRTGIISYSAQGSLNSLRGWVSESLHRHPDLSRVFPGTGSLL